MAVPSAIRKLSDAKNNSSCGRYEPILIDNCDIYVNVLLIYHIMYGLLSCLAGRLSRVQGV